MSGRALTWGLWVWAGLVFSFIFAPIVFSVIVSFNSDRFPTIPLGSFTTEWYAAILTDPDIWEAARNSVIVSLSTCVLATVLGFCLTSTRALYASRSSTRALPNKMAGALASNPPQRILMATAGTT